VRPSFVPHRPSTFAAATARFTSAINAAKNRRYEFALERQRVRSLACHCRPDCVHGVTDRHSDRQFPSTTSRRSTHLDHSGQSAVHRARCDRRAPRISSPDILSRIPARAERRRSKSQCSRRCTPIRFYARPFCICFYGRTRPRRFSTPSDAVQQVSTGAADLLSCSRCVDGRRARRFAFDWNPPATNWALPGSVTRQPTRFSRERQARLPRAVEPVKKTAFDSSRRSSVV